MELEHLKIARVLVNKHAAAGMTQEEAYKEFRKGVETTIADWESHLKRIEAR